MSSYKSDPFWFSYPSKSSFSCPPPLEIRQRYQLLPEPHFEPILVRFDILLVRVVHTHTSKETDLCAYGSMDKNWFKDETTVVVMRQNQDAAAHRDSSQAA